MAAQTAIEPGRGRCSRLASVAVWVSIVAATVVLTVALYLIDLPSPALFAGLLAGCGHALLLPAAPPLPAAGRTLGQAIVGVIIGLLFDPENLSALGSNWASVTLIAISTLIVSLLAGAAMRLKPGIDATTGALALIAGGASGLTAISRDLGADERVVAVVQNLRVVLIVLTMPVVALLAFGGDTDAGTTPPAAPEVGWPATAAITAGCVLLGVPLGILLRLPAGKLLGPLVVAAAGELFGLLPDLAVPDPVCDLGNALIGLAVGLGLTRASLRVVATALPLALFLITIVLVACAGLGVALSAMTGAAALDGYLATTPGGMFAVLATAAGTGADVTFVVSVQVIRLLLMLLSAPLLARILNQRRTLAEDEKSVPEEVARADSGGQVSQSTARAG